MSHGRPSARSADPKDACSYRSWSEVFTAGSAPDPANTECARWKINDLARPPVALVHDYLTQKGGAERVVLSMAKAFPEAPIYTSFYEPSSTFPGFTGFDVRPAWVNRSAFLRRDHRKALPVLQSVFSRMAVTADVVVCSSSGWAHGADVRGRKVVYCHTPARWLYQTERYLEDLGLRARLGLSAFRSRLVRWDRRSAQTADRYLANSRVVRDRIREIYGLDADLMPPPHSFDPLAEQTRVKGLVPGFALCVSRLMPYKNVEAVVKAFRSLTDLHLVVVGRGPLEEELRKLATPNVTILGDATDPELRWLYANCSVLVAASYEDFGLTPLEAGAFGRPVAALAWGGFLDTVVDGTTGVLFSSPQPRQIEEAVRRVQHSHFERSVIQDHAAKYGETEFIEKLRNLVMAETEARESS